MVAHVLIVMTARNASATISSAIASIVSQTYQDWVLVVRDDGSSDATAEIASQWTTTDRRVRVLPESSRLGRAASRNAILSSHDSEYVAIADADDLSLPRRLQLLVNRAEYNRQAGVVSGQVLTQFDDGTIRRAVWYPTDSAGLRDRVGRGNVPVSHAACLMRRHLVDGVGGYSTELLRAQDLELFLRMSNRGVQFDNIHEDVLVYRKDPTRDTIRSWLRLHTFHEYARYLSSFQGDRSDSGALLFGEWVFMPSLYWRPMARHALRFPAIKARSILWARSAGREVAQSADLQATLKLTELDP